VDIDLIELLVIALAGGIGAYFVSYLRKTHV